MTRRERVLAAFSHQKTDIVPYSVAFTAQEHRAVADYLGNPRFEQEIGNHIAVRWYSDNHEDVSGRPGRSRDSFGVIWDRSAPDSADIGIVEAPCLGEPTLAGYPFPNVDEGKWRHSLEEFIADGSDCFRFAANGFALYDKAWTMRGTENFLCDLLEEPAFVEELLDRIVAYNLRLIDIALEYPIDGFHFADDWASQRGLIMGASLWREYLKPRLRFLYDRVRAGGKIVSQHSCGNNLEIFEDLVELGLDVYQTLQPEVYDLAAVKRQYGDRLSFWGGISTQRLLPYATADEVCKEVRETLRLMSEDGGYVSGPSHDLVGGIPPENVVAMLRVLQQEGVE